MIGANTSNIRKTGTAVLRGKVSEKSVLFQEAHFVSQHSHTVRSVEPIAASLRINNRKKKMYEVYGHLTKNSVQILTVNWNLSHE